MSIIAIDLDGTLLSDKKEISNEDKKTMEKICENHSIIIVSGRSHIDVKNIVFNNNIKNFILPFIICRNGQEIYNINNSSIIHEDYLQFETLKSIIKTLEENEIYWYCISNSIAYCKDIKFNCLNYQLNGKYTLEQIKDIEDLTQVRVEKFVINEPITKKMLRIRRIIENLYDVEFMKYDLHKKYNDLQFMQNIIMKKNVNKYTSLKKLKELLNLSDTIISFSDGFNDYELIKNSTYGICMENGNEKIKEISKFITKSNNNSGFSFAINYMLESKILN